MAEYFVDDYEIDSKVPDGPVRQAHYVATSDEAAKAPSARLDLSYGPDPRQRLDIFAPKGAANAPAILFFHGGYWKGGGKESRRFPAPAWNARGVAWVPVEYRLAPAASLDDIVEDVRNATAWFYENAAKYKCNPDALHVAGNSAGGHITAMLLADGWAPSLGLPADAIKSGTAVSGLFDFEPSLVEYTSEWLTLDRAACERNSPLRHPPRRGVKVNISWGGKESAAFRDQSLAYAEICDDAGAIVSAFDRPDHDHFSIIGEFGDPDNPLFKAVEQVVL